MSYNHIKRAFLALALSAALVLTGCSAAGNTTTTSLLPTGEALAEAVTAELAQEDTQTAWEDASAVHISLNDDQTAVSGSGAAYADGVLTITEAGTYVLEGTLSNGQILINAAKKDTVRLVFNGVSVTSGNSAALYEQQADKVIITLAEGTQNSLADAAQYVYANGETEPDAALYTQDSLTINGSGSLAATGNYNHGIVSKDDLVITGGSLSVKAAGTGIRGRDSLTVTGGNITVDSQGDALQSNNDEDTAKGSILITGGTFDLTAASDGIQAQTSLTISDGNFTIRSGNGTVSSTASTAAEVTEIAAVSGATVRQPDNQSQQSGNQGGWDTQQESETESADSGKGLKAGGSLILTGGTYNINSADDAVHTNGDELISGGTFTLTTGDDGVHADGTATIAGGAITITSCYEGLEAANIVISGGDITITAQDDGLNAAGGNDGSATTGWRGQNEFADDGSYSIRVSGGTVTISASGDGVDSNGSIYMSGGTVLVDGPTNDGNGAIDYNGVFELTGGTLAAAGSSGMAQAPSSAANQAALMVYTQGSGEIKLLDSSGNVLISYTPAKSYASIVLSTPQMLTGQTYTLTLAGQTVASITLDSSVTTYGSGQGSFGQQMPGGGQNNQGGGRRRP